MPLMPKLTADLKEKLEQPITLSEVENAMDKVKPGKAPGPDGLGAEFYKAFKNQLAPFLHCVFSEAYILKDLIPSFSYTHTMFLPKSEDPSKLRSAGSYRPITLTNVDCKILMKLLAERLQSVIIHKHYRRPAPNVWNKREEHCN